jgi:hypothetical protein
VTYIPETKFENKINKNVIVIVIVIVELAWAPIYPKDLPT